MTATNTRSDHRWWPTTQRLVVLTFEHPEDAAEWDTAYDAFMGAARDVVDAWDEYWRDPEDVCARMDVLTNNLRRAMFAVRQPLIEPRRA